LDYLKITNENNEDLGGLLCGQKGGETVLVTGKYALMKFHSDPDFARKGFVISFTVVPHGKYMGDGKQD